MMLVSIVEFIFFAFRLMNVVLKKYFEQTAGIHFFSGRFHVQNSKLRSTKLQGIQEFQLFFLFCFFIVFQSQ